MQLSKDNIALVTNETSQIIGRHEVCRIPNLEANLHSDLIKCEKYPGHEQFIPFKDFKLDNIRQEHRSEDVYNWIQVNGNLTVRIKASYISKARPDYITDTCEEYPFAKDRGNHAYHSGTGFVSFITLVDKEDYSESPEANQHVLSPESGRSSVHRSKGAKLTIFTSSHVIFNEEETVGATVDFFYDSEKDKRHIKTLKGPFPVPFSGIVKGDWVDFICYTEDHDLISALVESKHRLVELESKLSPNAEVPPLVAIVSHPHGQHKHVTLGQIIPEQPLHDGGKTRMSNFIFHPNKTISFLPESKITFMCGLLINLPPAECIYFPENCPERCQQNIPSSDCSLVVLKPFSLRPLQKITIDQNHEFVWPADSKFECVTDAEFSYQNDNQIFFLPRGTKICCKTAFPKEIGRKYPHFFDIEHSVICEEYCITKKVKYDSRTCTGSSGAKVLFLTGTSTRGFSHSATFGEYGESGSGSCYKLRCHD